MWTSFVLSAILYALPIYSHPSSGPCSEWTFVQNGTTGITALEAVVLSPSLILIFDRVRGDPLQINGHQAWGAIWNTETNTNRAIDLITNSFCGSGTFLSNGSLVSIGGTGAEIPFDVPLPPDGDGLMGLRIVEPCDGDVTGDNCTIWEDPVTLHLAEQRWYPSSLRIYDGSAMVVGGIHVNTPFYNTPNLTASSIEFFPKKDGGVPRHSPFLDRTLPGNLFPRAFALPDGKIFMTANNQTIIYDIEAQTETVLPDIPNGVRITNPFDGTATLLPLSPPDYTPEILVCGGSQTSDQTPPLAHSSQDPASDQCSRITVTPEGIAKGWEIEHMPEGRMMPEMILIPDGQVLIINGAGSGYAATGSVSHLVNESNADHPVLTPVLYNPSAPVGHRFDRTGLPTTDIPRMYHSSVTLTPKGNIFIAGSNPNVGVFTNVTYNTEFRVEYLNPPYMSVARPGLVNVPAQIAFNGNYTVPVKIPDNLQVSTVQVALMDLGFSTHAFHQSSRLVFLNAEISSDKKWLTFTAPPNNRVFPPGPSYIFITVDDVTSEGIKLMVGNGLSPPVADQGVSL